MVFIVLAGRLIPESLDLVAPVPGAGVVVGVDRFQSVVGVMDGDSLDQGPGAIGAVGPVDIIAIGILEDAFIGRAPGQFHFARHRVRIVLAGGIRATY